MLSLSPLQASDTRQVQLIDIRPSLERYSGMGFVAGSMSVPQSNELRSDAAAIRSVAGNKIPVLVCLTGHRTHGMALALAQAIARPLGYLRGGLFAWNSEGLPLAGLRLAEAPHTPMEPEQFRATLRAELDLTLEDFLADVHDPAELVLQRCATAQGRSLEQCNHWELRTLLDLLAVVLLDFSVPREIASALLDRLLLRLPSAWSAEAVA